MRHTQRDRIQNSIIAKYDCLVQAMTGNKYENRRPCGDFVPLSPKNETQYSIHGATSGDTRHFTYRFDANQIEIVWPPYLPTKKRAMKSGMWACGDSEAISLCRIERTRTIHEPHQLLPSWLSPALWRINLPKCFFTIYFFLHSARVPFGVMKCVAMCVSHITHTISPPHIISHLHLWRWRWMSEWQGTGVPTRQRWTMCARVHSKQVNESSDDPHKRVFVIYFFQCKIKTKPFYHSPGAHSRRVRKKNIAFKPSIRFGNLFVIKLTTSRRQQRKFFSPTLLHPVHMPRTQPQQREEKIQNMYSAESIHALMSF